MDTFHAWGFRLIRANAALFGRAPGLTCLDEGDREKVFKRMCPEAGLVWNDKHERIQIKAMISFYSLLKNEGYVAHADKPQMLDKLAELMDRNAKWPPNKTPAMVKLALAYERENERTNVVDFDDLCLLPAMALQTNPSLADRLARRFQHITVDESQDTNRVQYAIVREIARRHPNGGNILMVGDDDQGLYSWRGARIQNLQQFVQDFSPRQFRLEQNYRSTPEIVRTAGRLICHNTTRMPKTPFSENPGGKNVGLGSYKTGVDQAADIARAVMNRLREGTPINQIAILYRTNRLSRLVEPALRARGIPTVVVGGASIYESPEIKAAIGGARLVANPRDLQALTAISEYVKGLGPTSIEKLGAILREMGPEASLWDAAQHAPPALRGIVFDLQRRIEVLKGMGPNQLGAWVAEEDGLNLRGHYESLIKEKSNKAAAEEVQHEQERRLNNLEAFDMATEKMGEFTPPESESLALDDDQAAGTTPAPHEHWTQLIELHLAGQLTPDEKTNAADAVTLSTIHRAKGLEWDVVYVAGFSEGILPLYGDQADADDVLPTGGIEEERRLAYVAITRAKKICGLFHSDSYGPFGPDETKPSRFIQEIKDGARVQAQQQAAPAPSSTPPGLPEVGRIPPRGGHVAVVRPAAPAIERPSTSFLSRQPSNLVDDLDAQLVGHSMRMG